MSVSEKTVVIIGSGLAGYMVAKEFRKLEPSASMAVITQSAGDFYSKPQLSTAFAYNKTAEDLALNSAEEMAQQLNAEVLNHSTVTRIDPDHNTVFFSNKAGEHSIVYHHLVLALGADKCTPPLQGNALSDVVSINDLEDYAAFRRWIAGKKRLAILGCGFVGSEFANDLVQAGFELDVIAPDDYPLQRLVPETVGHALQVAMEAKGVHYHLGVFANDLNSQGEQTVVALSDDSRVTVEGVICATGISPAVALAKTAGLSVNQGVQVDTHLRTSVKNIYALGDCAEVHGYVKQYVAPILQCARALSKTLVGQETEVRYPPMPIVIKTPICPVVTIPPHNGVEGEWKTDVDAHNVRALFYTPDNTLAGFALSGACVKEKMQWAKQMQGDF